MNWKYCTASFVSRLHDGRPVPVPVPVPCPCLGLSTYLSSSCLIKGNSRAFRGTEFPVTKATLPWLINGNSTAKASFPWKSLRELPNWILVLVLTQVSQLYFVHKWATPLSSQPAVSQVPQAWTILLQLLATIFLCHGIFRYFLRDI